jgi:hypothetical protein
MLVTVLKAIFYVIESQKTFCAASAVGPLKTANSAGPPRNRSSARPFGRGLARFLGRRFAVPQWGRVRFAPLWLTSPVNCRGTAEIWQVQRMEMPVLASAVMFSRPHALR